jgi:phenylpropionate dioxygenase-like ring-hydroxylating dioxygenase large terminal subunit
MGNHEAGRLMEETPFQVMKRTWQPVALSAELPVGKILSYKLFDVDLVLARFPSGLMAAEDSCPHKGARLSRGSLGDGELQCCYHGWRFNGSGECTNIPSLLNPPKDKLKLSHLRNYAVQERYGMIWVQMESDESIRLPDVPEFENPDWTFLVGPPTPFKAGFRREIENYLDMTHFAFAHATTLGRAASPAVPEMEIILHEDGFQMDAPFPALETTHEPPGKLQSGHHRRQRCFLPNFTTIRQTFADGDERVLVHIPSPNTPTDCTCFWALAVSPGFDGPPPGEQLRFAIGVLDEDRIMCENQVPREVPINPSRGGWGVLVTPGDTLANTFQKCFRKYLTEATAEKRNGEAQPGPPA